MKRKAKSGATQSAVAQQNFQPSFVPKADSASSGLGKRKVAAAFGVFSDDSSAPSAKRSKPPPKTSQLAKQKHIVSNASAPSVIRKEHYVQLDAASSKDAPKMASIPPREEHSIESLEFPSYMHPLPPNLRAVVNITEYVSELKREGPIEDTMSRFRRLVEDTYAPLRLIKIPLLPIKEPLEGDIGLTSLQKNDELRRKMIQSRRVAGGSMKSIALLITEAYNTKKEEFYRDLFELDNVPVKSIRTMVYSTVVLNAFLSSKDSPMTMEELFKAAESKSDIYTNGLPTFEVVDPLYNQDFLRPACSSRKKERPCSREATCVGQRLIPGHPFREFLLPSELERVKSTGELPSQRSMCLPCTRFYYTSHAIMHTQTNAHNCPGAHASALLPINRFVEKVGDGGYDPRFTLLTTYKIDVLKPSQPCDVPNRLIGTIVAYNETTMSRTTVMVDKTTLPSVQEHSVFSQ